MRWRLVACAGVSVAVHAGLLWPLLPHGTGRSGADAAATFEVELVEQPPERQGGPADAGAAAAAAEPAAAPVPASGEPARPPPAPPTRPPSPRAPAVNLGGGEREQEGLVVSGPNVVPPRPDALVRNRPPSYPAEAVRRGSEGIVGLVAHISALGIPAWVDVSRSSGDASLDQAARDAVAGWRFQPARQGGAAVAFDYELNIRFKLEGR